MDWITTSGKSLDEAKSHALDQLGIVADEAEFDVVSDVEKGLFGRIKSEAKIRARVRPKQPTAKDERGNGRRRSGGGGGNRNRGRGKGGNGNKGGNGGGQNTRGNNRSGGNDNGGNSKGQGQNNGGGKSSNGGNNRSDRSENKNNGNNNGRNNRSDNKNSGNGGRGASAAAAGAGAGAAAASNQKKKKDTVETIEMNREDQEQTAHEFLEGVLGAFGMTGSVALAEEPADDDAIEMTVTGEELGLLVGQKGVTLNALQELTRTVVQRKADGAKTSRLRVDVAGYRARRTAALQDFSRKIAADVLESGTEKLMEPMGPADRKVVHDTVNDIDGVETGSEGEEPRRRVVIRPA